MSIPVHSSVLIPHSSTCSLTNTATIDKWREKDWKQVDNVYRLARLTVCAPWATVKARTQEHVTEHGMEVRKK